MRIYYTPLVDTHHNVTPLLCNNLTVGYTYAYIYTLYTLSF